MSRIPSDAYDTLPNLAGDSGRIEEIRSQGDPGRVFPSARRGSVDAVTGRILNVPRIGLVRSALHNIGGTGAFDYIQWDTLEYDTDGMWDIANPTVVTIKTPGIWMVSVAILWPANPANNRVIGIIVNGVSLFAAKRDADGVANGSQEMAKPCRLFAGDQLKLGAAQGTGATITLSANGVQSTHDHHLTAYLASTFGSDNQ